MRRHVETHREEGQERMEAETGGRQPPGARREAGNSSPSEPEGTPADTLTLGFWPPEL